MVFYHYQTKREATGWQDVVHPINIEHNTINFRPLEIVFHFRKCNDVLYNL